MKFDDRIDAGNQLARALTRYSGMDNILVLALPRGGVPVAYQVAKELQAPLDVFLVRKLGVPGHEELAMGAIATGGIKVMNQRVVETMDISELAIDEVARQEQQELERREKAYRGERPMPELEERVIILVDDGLATGASMRAAVSAVRTRSPERIVVAVPTAPPETCTAFEDDVDDMVCHITPTPFMGVGGSYKDFTQTTDDEVRHFLEKARKNLPEAQAQ